MTPSPQPSQQATRSTYTVSPRKMTARDLIFHSKPWQYGASGRQHRVVNERMRRVARALARFDRSGECQSIYPSVQTLLGRLQEAEANYKEKPQGTRTPWRYRMSWSRSQVFEYLARLRKAGISENGGLSSYHGTRRRVLRPAKLRAFPREDRTPTPREDRTGSKDLESKKLQFKRKSAADRKQSSALPGTPKSADDRATPPPHQHIPTTTGKAETLKAKAKAFLLRDGRYSEPYIDLAFVRALDISEAKLKAPPRSAAWFITVVENTLTDPDDRQEIENLLTWRTKAGIPASAPLEPHEKPAVSKIAFVHRVVEEADRTGRWAAEVLAEKLGLAS